MASCKGTRLELQGFLGYSICYPTGCRSWCLHVVIVSCYRIYLKHFNGWYCVDLHLVWPWGMAKSYLDRKVGSTTPATVKAKARTPMRNIKVQVIQYVPCNNIRTAYILRIHIGPLVGLPGCPMDMNSNRGQVFDAAFVYSLLSPHESFFCTRSLQQHLKLANSPL